MTLLLLFNNQVAPNAAQVVPDVQVLLETTADVMVDISADYEMFTTIRGRNRELDRFQAGTARVQLKDTARKYDPSNAASPYYPNLKPMRALQLTGTWLGTTYPIFTGTVDSFESVYDGPPNGNATTTIYATDGFKALEAANLASSGYVQEVLADAPAHLYRLDEAADAATLFDSIGTRDLDVEGAPEPADSLVSREPGGATTMPGNNDGGINATTRPAVTAVTVEVVFSTLDVLLGSTLIAELNDVANRGYDLQAQPGPPSNAYPEFTVATSAGTVQVSSAGAIDDGLPHHIAGVWDGTNIYLYVDGALAASGALGGTMFTAGQTTSLVVGGATNGPVSNNGSAGTYQLAAIYETALSAARVAVHAAEVSTPWDGDLPGARIGRVLDAVAWPAAARQLDTGTSTLQAAQLEEVSALEHATKAAESDFGVLFMTADGRVRFIGRAGLFNKAELATFGDGGGAELPYRELRPELTDQLIRNDVTVSRLEGIAQNAKDATSIGVYLRHSYTADGLLHDSDTLSRSAAEFLVSEFKDPIRRVSGMVVTPRSDPANLYPKALGLELEDQITVLDRPPGGGAANTQDTSIEGITHTSSPLWWETTWNLAPSFGSQGTPPNVWALGIAGFSELGVTTRLGF